MEINDINIGETYLDNGNGSFSTPYKFIIVTEKSINSIRFKDSGGFYSWMHIDSFKKRMRLKQTK